MTTAYSLGVVAFGDSITNGGGELQWGVALQSWALWTARALGLPYSPYAVDGATAADVVGCQLPAFQSIAAHPFGRYDLGCLYVGANDVRRQDWDPHRFASELATAHSLLAVRCHRRLAATLPLDLGRPRAGARVDEANAVIEAAAAAHGALVLDLSGFGARNLLMADHVHPTAFGQIAIAERALDVLAIDGMDVRVRPSTLVSYESPWRRRLRGDLSYTYRHLKVSARAVAARRPPSRPGAEPPTPN